MLRSLYSGVSGMRSFQTKMDVISNNIANVNTIGYKSARAKFQDMLSQTVASGQRGSEEGLGGVNGQQIGLGVKVGSIDIMMVGGALQPTNRSLDFALEGDGFFPVSQDSKGQLKSYTRDGGFFRDYEGNLVNASGMRVLGYIPKDPKKPGTSDEPNLEKPKEDGENAIDHLKPLVIPEKITGKDGEEVELDEYTIDGTGQIIGIYSDGNAYVLGQIGVVKFSNPEGLEKSGDNNYIASNNSGDPIAGEAGGYGYGYIRQGFLEMSNVDLANEFTEMIVTNRAYQANSRSITTSDEMLQELINLKR